MSKKFKIKNLSYSTEGDIAYLKIDTEEKKIIKKYLPNYDSKIVFQNTKVKLTNSKTERTTELNGLIKVKDQLDSFSFKEIYNYSKNIFNINGVID